MLWFCTFHRTISCPHVAFECFKLALWPTLRQKFMNFWNVLTLPGDNDEKISNCTSTPKLVQAHDFSFSHDKTHNVMVFREISFWNEMFLRSILKRKWLLLLNRNWFSTCKRRESQAATDFATVLPDTCRPYVLQMRRNESKYANNCHNHACFPRIYLSIS